MTERRESGWRSAMRVMIADGRSSMEQALAIFEPMLRRVARGLTQDADLREDLVQEGRIRLWELDPARFDLRRLEEVKYVGRAIVRWMHGKWRAEVARALG